MKIQILILLAFCMTILTSCDDTNNFPKTGCGDAIILDTDYDAAIGDDFVITDVTITDNCLTATIEYGGGCGDELVSFELLGSTAAFPVTFPAMLETKIIMDDNDDCEAWVTKEISFDLTPLQDENYNNINVIVEGRDGSFQYSF